MNVILTHNNADFDAAAALLAAHKLYPDAMPVLPRRLNRNVLEFITLYQNGLPFIRWEEFTATQVDTLILVDTQRIPEGRRLESSQVLIIDHHPRRADLPENTTFTGEEIGSTTTLLAEQMRTHGTTLTSLEATLLALGIYEDTGSLTYGKTTPRDIQAAAWLVEKKAVLDTVRRFLSPPLSAEQHALLELMIRNAESRTIQGYTVIICAAKLDSYVEELNSVAHRLGDLLDPAVLVMATQMPNSLQIVFRSNGAALDVSLIAREMGGGGHSRAAAANIDGGTLETVLPALWALISTYIRPVTRVADLMSYGVQTVDVSEQIGDVIHRLRRIGHEGFPVLEGGRVVGLLTRRDADRAMEHGLKRTPVRDIMNSGQVTLTPDDSVSKLEHYMVESNWGQIPVVDDEHKLIGIVTRTDLIKHWVKSHPATPTPHDKVEVETIQRILGMAVYRLIDAITQHATQHKINVYLVGGVVRDLLLDRPNLDIDFVVESSAITLAHQLSGVYGGKVNAFAPFGTAKWRITSEVAHNLGVHESSLPEHVDFATSRNEFYEHPTALPKVYNSSIKLDLQRRDFTINTLAIQISPAAALGRVLDYYGGLSDLNGKIIRVLHSLSFIDDPTRILRAVRFEQRLGFTIEPRTAELIDTALPMLGKITGERVRNELELILNESEPEASLIKLHGRGILQAIHPAFILHTDVSAQFQALRGSRTNWPINNPETVELYWHALFSAVELGRIPDLAERLLIGQKRGQSVMGTAVLLTQPGVIADAHARISAVTDDLERFTEPALLTAWIITTSTLVRGRISAFLTTWRHLRPATTGETLHRLGLAPGPIYKKILNRLRSARLDGEINTDDEERVLLDALIGEYSHDRS